MEERKVRLLGEEVELYELLPLPPPLPPLPIAALRALLKHSGLGR